MLITTVHGVNNFKVKLCFNIIFLPGFPAYHFQNYFRHLPFPILLPFRQQTTHTNVTTLSILPHDMEFHRNIDGTRGGGGGGGGAHVSASRRPARAALFI
jgi:hypothetical protein